MTEEISQRELRNDSGRIMRQLDEGKSFVLTRNGTPVGELRPLRRQRFISRAVFVEMFAPLAGSHADFRNDIDRWVDQGIDPRG